MSRWFFPIFLLIFACLPASASAHVITLPSGKVVQDGHHVKQDPLAPFAARQTAPFVIGGGAWPKKTLYYFDATPRGKYRTAVAKAIYEWNSRGMRVKFRKTTCARCADFKIMRDRRISPGGLATVGYWGRAGSNAYWVKLNMDGYQWPDIAWVASHELGHIYGLGHSRGCAVMSYAAYTACKWPQNTYQWRCRLQEADDLRGVKRLYGGSFRVRPTPFCLKNPASGAVTGLTAAAGSTVTHVATVSWGAAARAAKYQISAGLGTCPQSPTSQALDVSTQTGRTFVHEGDSWQPPVAGLYCYSVWSVNVDGYVNPASRATFALNWSPPAVPQATGVNVTGGPWIANEWSDKTWQGLVQWNHPPQTIARVLRKVGSCPTGPDDWDATSIGNWAVSASPVADNFSEWDLPAGGSICYVVFTSDDNGSSRWAASSPFMLNVPSPN